MNQLESYGISSGEHYPRAIPDQAAMQSCAFEVVGNLEKARRFCSGEVSLPIHPYLRDEEVAAVIEAVNRWRP